MSEEISEEKDISLREALSRAREIDRQEMKRVGYISNYVRFVDVVTAWFKYRDLEKVVEELKSSKTTIAYKLGRVGIKVSTRKKKTI